MLISDVLAAKGNQVTTILPDATVVDAVRRLAEMRIGALVVEDRWQRLRGIFTERDLVHLLAREGPEAVDREVQTVMTERVITCHPSDKIDDILAVMTMHRVRHLPVLDAAKLVGIVSIGDLVNHRLNEKRQEAEVLLEIARMRA
jgi:CBS domain-containing protein